jgi:signal transduction histidine kinase
MIASRCHPSIRIPWGAESTTRMRPRTVSGLVWSVGIFSIALMVGALILMFGYRHATLPATVSQYRWNFPNVLNAVVNFGLPVVGAVLASKRPENRIGWLFLAGGFIVGFYTFGFSYAVRALVVAPGSLPAGRWFAWIGTWMLVITLPGIAYVFLLFPTGHLPSPRWRAAGWFVASSFALGTVGVLVALTLSWNEPFGPSTHGGRIVLLLLALPIVGSFALSLAAVVVRFLGSWGDERLQLKWFATAAAIVLVTFFLQLPWLSCSLCSPPAVISVASNLAVAFFWLAISMAVLKYHLYEIDVAISKAVVYGTLAVFITLVYVGLVAGGGALVGHRGSALLSAAAAAAIAVAFQPIRVRGRRLASRIVYGKRATPYEVLGEFSSRVGETLSIEDVLPQMAQTLAEGTGAARADVWLNVGDELRDEASWPAGSERFEPVRPAGDDVSAIGADLATAVRHRGELLGAVSITKRSGEPLTYTESKLVTDLASQAGLVLRNAQLTRELLARLEELRASRQRIVTAQDQARRRLERNIHDGAQQQLVALAVKANLARTLARKDAEAADAMLGQLQADAQNALEDLRDLARGIYPPLLADSGLSAAIEAQAKKSAVPVLVEADGIGRYPQEAEAAVYFCCLEALQNIAKYAGAHSARVRLSVADDHQLSFEVTDDGKGFDPGIMSYGTGLQGMADRLAALDGTLEVRSKPGAGTTIAGSVPV